MCVHIQVCVTSFVQKQTKLLFITVHILKAEHVLVFAELWPKWLYNAKDEAGHSFLW